MDKVEKEELESLITMLEKKYKSDFSFLRRFEIFKNSENKYFIFSGDYLINGERFGLEAFKLEKERIRLNFHFANMFKESIKDFFIEVNKEIAKRFIKGEDIKKEEINNFDNLIDEEFYLIKFSNYFIGTAKVSKKEKVLKNYLAKQYRFKNLEL
ncbi:MAG TPA: hypothetical protein EYH54_05080 [Nautiliaceae bacterium]|nr:hypothetical protein [Nautiliaceae bacterium]